MEAFALKLLEEPFVCRLLRLFADRVAELLRCTAPDFWEELVALLPIT